MLLDLLRSRHLSVQLRNVNSPQQVSNPLHRGWELPLRRPRASGAHRAPGGETAIAWSAICRQAPRPR